MSQIATKRRLLPPHAPDDEAYVAKMVASLERDYVLPAVVAFHGPEHDQAISGSHRLAAWAEFERRTGEDRRRVVFLAEGELLDGFEQLRLPRDLALAWPRLRRIGDLAEAIHWTTKRRVIKELLYHQW